MNNKNLTLIFSSVVVGFVLASAGYYYISDSPDEKVLRKLKYAEPNPLKDKRVSAMPCSDERISSLRVKYNEDLLWEKTHEEFFAMDEILTLDHRRLKGRKQVLPLLDLLQGRDGVQFIDFIDCGGKKTALSVAEIKQSPDDYFLGENNKGWLKLMRRDEKPRYNTIEKAIVYIHVPYKQYLIF